VYYYGKRWQPYRSSPCSSIAVRYRSLIGSTSGHIVILQKAKKCSTKIHVMEFLAANFLACSLRRDERESHRHHLSCGRKAKARKSRFAGSKLGDTPKTSTTHK